MRLRILKGHPFSAGRAVLPGMAVAVLAAMAAEFLSDHYGAPSMLMAILIGLPLNFLSDDARTQPGLAFVSRNVLRLGGALLGLRIGIDTILGLGHVPLLIVVAGVPVTILFGIALAWRIRQSPGFGFPTGGAVAICGASAAMAISAILPPSESRDRNLSFTVITVTIMSTLATILYPVLASGLRLDPATTGLLPGSTIHDVAQVAGAGFSASSETGGIAIVLKLVRVALLAPVLMIAVVMLRRTGAVGSGRVPMVPGFVVAFMALACANASGAVPAGVGEASMPLIAPSDPGPSNPTQFGFQGIAVDFVEWP
jgi:uncharacterized integral membrane protein (TIGR00698 family)